MIIFLFDGRGMQLHSSEKVLRSLFFLHTSLVQLLIINCQFTTWTLSAKTDSRQRKTTVEQQPYYICMRATTLQRGLEITRYDKLKFL